MVSSSGRLGVNDTHHNKDNDLTVKTAGIERERSGKTEVVSVPNPYQELISRLEKASGPDRELGNKIPPALGYVWNGRLMSHNPRGRWEHPNGSHLPDADFTGSIDAALTLVPEGWIWTWSGHEASVETNNGRFLSADHIDIERYGKGATPAIAICIAALRARSAA